MRGLADETVVPREQTLDRPDRTENRLRWGVDLPMRLPWSQPRPIVAHEIVIATWNLPTWSRALVFRDVAGPIRLQTPQSEPSNTARRDKENAAHQNVVPDSDSWQRIDWAYPSAVHRRDTCNVPCANADGGP